MSIEDLALSLSGDYPAMDRLRRTRLEEARAILSPATDKGGE